MESHTRTLDQLPTAVAIFDGRKRLVFHNAAYRQVWGLPQGFSTRTRPIPEIPRPAARRTPPARTGRFPNLEKRRVGLPVAGDARAPVWYLPDGRASRRLESRPAWRRHLSLRRRKRTFQIEVAVRACERAGRNARHAAGRRRRVRHRRSAQALPTRRSASIWRLDNDALADKAAFRLDRRRGAEDLRRQGGIRQDPRSRHRPARGAQGFDSRVERSPTEPFSIAPRCRCPTARRSSLSSTLPRRSPSSARSPIATRR